MIYTQQQEAAIKAIKKWYENDTEHQQVFRLFGYAGTGKTTIIRDIVEILDVDAVYGAYTGKAASVMRSKGCDGASTIHSLIYRAYENPDGTFTFRKNWDSVILDSDIILLDEISMVGSEIGEDLLSFNKPIIVVGDPAQLPPIKGEGFFNTDKPDVMLTEIHRQAKDNPIVQLSMDVRKGRRLKVGTYGESKIITEDDLEPEDIIEADQMLVGLNRTRIYYNKVIRESFGYQSPFPCKGERLICTRNNHGKGLLNGCIWEPTEDARLEKNQWLMFEAIPEGGELKTEMKVHKDFFTGDPDKLEWHVRKLSDCFQSGFSITVHRGQGSEWSHVLLFASEARCFRQHQMNWLYTGITRASEKITIVI